MKKQIKKRITKQVGLFAAVTALLVLSCHNPYVVHNLARPVQLAGIEVRSDRLESDDPSYSLNRSFTPEELHYTVTVDYDAELITISGFPEEGARVSGETEKAFALDQQVLTFTIVVEKEHRPAGVYVIDVMRGLPEARLADIELYISGGNNPDSKNMELYEHDNFLAGFASSRDTYTARVPAYTNHIALVIKSYDDSNDDPKKREKKISGITCEFKNWKGQTIGEDGVTPQEGFFRAAGASTYWKQPLPLWYKPEKIEWGNIQYYDGGTGDSPSWFGRGFVTDPQDPDPNGEGKAAEIVITAYAKDDEGNDRLSPKKYTIKIQREIGYAYLQNLEVLKITGTGMGPALPGTDGSGDADAMPNNCVIGSFARTNLNYDAALSDEANGVRVVPRPDPNISGAGGMLYTYIPYYFDQEGVRYALTADGRHIRSSFQDGDPPLDDQEPARFLPGYPYLLKAPDTGGIDFYFDITNNDFAKYVRMEIVVIVKVASGPYFDRAYRVRIMRNRDKAVIHDISVVAYNPDMPLKADGLTPALPDDDDPKINNGYVGKNGETLFNRRVASHTLDVESGSTFVRITIHNGENSGAWPAVRALAGRAGDTPVPGSKNRRITVTGPDKTWVFSREGDFWIDETNRKFADSSLTPMPPYADIGLNGRNTQVRVNVADVPNFTENDYFVNILAKNANDIVLPPDEKNDGQVRAVFVSGDNRGLNTQHALPGELIELSIKAQLGYYIDETYTRDGYKRGVMCKSKTLVMDSEVCWQTGEKGSASRAKERVYRFYMPDENVEFDVKYKPTTTSLNNIAYVASSSRFGGGYGCDIDPVNHPGKKVGGSWGTASSDLQAVINSWDGANYEEIWLLAGTYTPPDPANYIRNENYPAGKDPNCFPAGYPRVNSANEYHVTGCTLSGLAGKGDIAFVLRPNLVIRGGFEETDNNKADRGARPEAAQSTILSGEYPDGTNAYHVVVAALDTEDVSAELDTLTVSGGIGPEATVTSLGASSFIQVAPAGGQPLNVYREGGGGIYSTNSRLRLNNVQISDNRSTLGGGMLAVSQGKKTETTLVKTSFLNNAAVHEGGGMYNTVSSNTNNLVISGNSSFSGNKAFGTSGGGGLYVNSVTSVISDTVFDSNSAANGGGIYAVGGTSTLAGVRIAGNTTSGSGSGMYNSSDTLLYNADIVRNFSKSGNGAGIFNGENLRITNSTLSGNQGAGRGGGLYNGGKAVLTNVTFDSNSCGSGGGIASAGNGKLIVVNGIITKNTAVSGGGLANSGSKQNSGHVILVNVTIEKNEAETGGGIFNQYEGYDRLGDHATLTGGSSLNVLLQNVRITNNKAVSGGGGVYNDYYRYWGRGLNLTLNNTTIANNTGEGVYTIKRDNGTGSGTDYPWAGSSSQAAGVEDDDAPFNRRAFPVYIRFRNTVVHGNSGAASLWAASGSAFSFKPADVQERQEYYDHSLLQGMTLDVAYYTAARGNLPGDAAPGFSGGFRPGATGVLAQNTANPALYPADAAGLLAALDGVSGNHTGINTEDMNPLIFADNTLVPKEINYFLMFDNSFNSGDLRANNGAEGPKTKTRPSGNLSIGAYDP